MAKFCIILALLFVGGFAFPTETEDVQGFDEDMSIFFDHTVLNSESRIVGGTNAPDGGFPWMVAMLTGIGSRTYLCGGSVLNARRVLTAAHCIVAALSGSSLNRNLRVVVGTNRWNSGGQTLELERHHNHPQYHAGTIKNDIGILVTRTNINMNTRVRAVPMAWDNVGGNVACRVSGWGRIRAGGALSDNLLYIQTRTIDGPRCVTDLARMATQLGIRAPHVDPAIEICTFVGPNHGTCNGDSGSALVRNSNNQQIGIVSWGLPCARGAPDMFVRISAFRNFITQHS